MQRTFRNLQDSVAIHVAGPVSNMSTDLKTQVKYAVNSALSFLTNRIRFQQLKTDITITLFNGQNVYELPDRVSHVVKNTAYYVPTGRAIGDVMEQEWNLHGQNARNDNGAPEAFSDFDYNPVTNKLRIKVYPTPGSSEDGKAIKMYAYKSPAAMSDDDDIPPLPEQLHEILVHGAIILGFSNFIDQQSLLVHSQAWQQGIRQASRFKDPMMGRRRPLKQSPHQGRRFGALSNVDFDTLRS